MVARSSGPPVGPFVEAEGQGHNHTSPGKAFAALGDVEVPSTLRRTGTGPSGSALVLVDDPAEDIVAADGPKMCRS
jgi:hypothetical protein